MAKRKKMEPTPEDKPIWHGEIPRCSFCGVNGHGADTCALKIQADRESAREAERRASAAGTGAGAGTESVLDDLSIDDPSQRYMGEVLAGMASTGADTAAEVENGRSTLDSNRATLLTPETSPAPAAGDIAIHPGELQEGHAEPTPVDAATPSEPIATTADTKARLKASISKAKAKKETEEADHQRRVDSAVLNTAKDEVLAKMTSVAMPNETFCLLIERVLKLKKKVLRVDPMRFCTLAAVGVISKELDVVKTITERRDKVEQTKIQINTMAAAKKVVEIKKKEKAFPLCKCGCGEQTRGGTFRQGHDAKYYSAMRKVEGVPAHGKRK